MPKVSVIIPCYNHGQYVREAIASVEQCPDKSLYEIIIVNDGSTDTYTNQLMRQLQQEGYHVINQENQGLAAARNNGIKAAVADYILPLDSDNKIRPAYLLKGVEILDSKPEIAMVYGDAQFFGDSNLVKTVGPFNLQQIMIENYIDACAVFRKSVWESLGGYDKNMPYMGFEDWDLWLNMQFNNYRFYYINEILFDYRVLSSSMLQSMSRTKKKAVFDYLDEKYTGFLKLNHLNNELQALLKRNKKIVFKLVIQQYFPGAFNWLTRKNIIKDPEIF